jgi:hypothetical protein
MSYRLTFEEFKMWVQRNPEIVDYIGELRCFLIHLFYLLVLFNQSFEHTCCMWVSSFFIFSFVWYICIWHMCERCELVWIHNYDYIVQTWSYVSTIKYYDMNTINIELIQCLNIITYTIWTESILPYSSSGPLEGKAHTSKKESLPHMRR